ncbi:MAG: competence/damage-inducible protein A [Chthoniobacterales bacterium]|nr:competence/damage-inducible protein A [Chthoniobacterales bacterium]
MVVEVLNTGTELLLGDVLNTHAAWFGKQLLALDLSISRQTTVPDGEAIRSALRESFSRADVILVTGGLGPTTDDLTREITADLLGLELVADAEVRRKIEALVVERGSTMRVRMLRQTMIPRGATVLPNDFGSAPGLYLPGKESPRSPHLFLLPGPPREMQPMFTASVLPLLKKLNGSVPHRECRIYRIVGMGESAVEECVGLGLSERGDLDVGYCARPNEVDLRLIGAPQTLDEVEPKILAAVGNHLFSRTAENLEDWVVTRLREQGRRVATAESCSGGLLAHRLTNVPGASEVFTHGFIVYSNEAKTALLGVPQKMLEDWGAVSEPVARSLAEGALEKSGADFALSLTGIAGPGGGSTEKPLGLLFIGLARRGKPTLCKNHLFPRDRETFKQLATQTALDMLRHELL